MRILFVLEHYYPNIGGVERLFKNLAENLQAHNYQVTVITTKLNKADLSREKINDVNIIRLPFYNRFLFTFLSLPWIIYYALKSDIIHTTSYNAAFPASIASIITRKKCMITFHEVWDQLWYQLPYYYIGRKTLFFLFEKIILALPFYKYIAVSDSTRNALIKSGVNSSAIIRIYNGISYDALAKFNHVKPINPVICYYGRLGASKGLDNLLDALKDMKQRFQLLLIIPKQPSFIYKKIQQKLIHNHLVEKTILKHNLSDEELFTSVSKASFVVIPSLSEGFCFNAVECAAMNVPVVVSKNTALLETVSGKHIYIQNSLKDAIIKALNDNWEITETKKFPTEDTIHNYMEVYNQIASAF